MPQKHPKMMRHNDGKPKLSFILDFPNSMKELSQVLEGGAEKYSRHNWKEGAPQTEIEDSLVRHLIAFHNGEDIDEESGQSHMAHVVCNALFILETYYIHGGEFDDRDDRCRI